MFKSLLALVALLSIAGPVAAQPAADPNRLFADSKLVVRERFSDEIVGKGPDVVFIPGLSSSRAVWKATAERLRGHYRLHLIQVAGFAGEAARANAKGEVLIPTAEAIDAYLVEQKLTPATLVGHSLGATSTLYLVEKHPEHLKRAMLVDALPFIGVMRGNPAATVESVKPMAEKMRDTMAAGGDGYVAGVKGSVNAMVSGEADRQMVTAWGVASDPSVVGRAYYDDFMLDLRPGLAAIRTPVLLLYPDNVPMGAPAGAMDRFYPAIYAPATTLKAHGVANSRHFIMLDQPQAFAEALDGFLSQP